MIREFSPEQESAIVAAYVAGSSVNKLKTEYGAPWHQVADVLKARGVFEGHKRQHILDREAEMIRRYQAGESLSEVGAAFGVTHSRIYAILKRRGVDRRPVGAPEPEYPEQIEKLRDQGLGARKIAKELGIGVTTVQKWLRRAGKASPREQWGTAAGGRKSNHGPHAVGDYVAVWVPLDDPYRVMAHAGRGYVMEHRLVMARSLGRPLTRRETVHHVNGDTLDNRLINLQLRKGQHGKGVVMQCLDCGSHNVQPVSLPEQGREDGSQMASAHV